MQKVQGIRVTDGKDFGAAYDDADVLHAGEEDAGKGVFTDIFGEDNRAPRMINAICKAALVASHLIAHRLHETLIGIDSRLEPVQESIKVAKAEARTLAIAVADAAGNHRNLSERMRNEGIAPPEGGRRRLLLEIALLTPLGLGDVLFISLAYQILGLSDRPMASFLPFSELQLAASTSVAALLICARIAGHRVRRFSHLLGLLIGRPSTGSPDEAQLRRNYVAGSIQAGAETFLALGGAAAVLMGVNAIRAAYLEGRGIPAHAGPFLLVQTGIAAAGVLLAAWFAHPYERDWKESAAALAAVKKPFNDTVERVSAHVADYNTLRVERVHRIAQHDEWNGAQLADAARQIESYARWLLLGQPEPTTDRLLPDELPQPESAPWATRHRQALDAQAGRVLTQSFERADLDDVAALLSQPINDGEAPKGGEEEQPRRVADATGSYEGAGTGGVNGHGRS
jgi:hypothetical protein